MEVRVKAGPQPAATRSQSLDADRASATLLYPGNVSFARSTIDRPVDERVRAAMLAPALAKRAGPS